MINFFPSYRYRKLLSLFLWFHFKSDNYIIQEYLNMDPENKEYDIIVERPELIASYKQIQRKCQLIEDFEDPGNSHEDMIAQCSRIQKSITAMSMFSENQTLKQIATQDLKFLVLPYYIGFLYGKISQPRKNAIIQAKNYLQAYLNLMKLFNCEEEELFPPNVMKIWLQVHEKEEISLSREQVIANHKEKKNIQTRYQNSLKFKEECDERQSIKDFMALKVYEAFNQIKTIKEELKILAFRDTLEKDPAEKQKYEQEGNKPIPKMKIWNIQKPEQIQRDMLPPEFQSLQEKRKDEYVKTFTQNKNQPTMTLREVAKMQEDNMLARMEREKKQKEENVVDTDSQKEQVDDRQKKEARNWDDWKDDNEKGAGNRNNR